MVVSGEWWWWLVACKPILAEQYLPGLSKFFSPILIQSGRGIVIMAIFNNIRHFGHHRCHQISIADIANIANMLNRANIAINLKR